jgi:lysophospholipase L1-like esterase
MRLRRTSLILGFILVQIVTGWAKEQNTSKESRWEKAIQEFENWDAKNAWPKKPILFAGSSSIRMWPTRECLPELPVINRGFGGSQISDVNDFLERIVLKYKPKLIVFYCGDNDINAGKSPEQVFDDYRQFVSRVHADLPKTKIIYISIKPSGARWNLWPKMKQTNEMIQTFSENNKRLYYTDCATCLLTENGKPNDELFIKDRLHLNEKGYAKWKTALLPILQEALKKEKKKK